MCLQVEIELTNLPKLEPSSPIPNCNSPDFMLKSFHTYRRPGLLDFKNKLSFDCNVSIKFRIAI
jgi:hypothetical protein